MMNVELQSAPSLPRLRTGILTVIAVNAFSGAPVLAIGSADFSRLVVGVALFIFNFIYFRNRAALFTE